MSSLRSKLLPPIKTGKDTSASAGCLFPLELISDTLAVEKILSQFPSLPPRVVIALTVAQLLSRNVTPFKLCPCGCGEPLHGKERLASAACRKREQRRREALAAGGPKQFGLVMQNELPVKIPACPVQPPPKPDTDMSLNVANADTDKCDRIPADATIPFQF